MRKRWEYKKIGNLCNISTGKLDANAANENGLYPFFTCSKTPLSINSYAYDCECVLVAGNGDLNVKYYNGKFNAYQRTYILQLKNNSINVDMRFIYAFFNLYIEELRKKSIGGIIKYIKLGDLTNAKLPCPPLSTQLAIVSELDKINELIRLKKEQLKDFDNLAQSLFYEMFGDPVENEKGWDVKKLDNVCNITSSKRIFADEYTNTGIPFYRSKEVIERSKGLPISVELFISEERYNEIKEKFGVPKIGDILITAVGTIGKIWAIDTDNKFYFKDGNLVWLKDIDNQLANSCFFRRLLEYLIEEYKKTNANGAAYNALTIAKLKLMSCPLPPLSLQRLFAQRIEQIEREKSEVQKSIQDLETLLASRMQYWFE